MKILVLNEGDDTGSVGIRIKQAFDRHAGPDWEVRAVRTTNNYAQHDYDIQNWPAAEVRELYLKADVVHWMEQFRGIGKIGRALVDANPKPAVLHHHGEIFRDYAPEILAKAEELHAIQLVSTIDLLAMAPNLRWLPSPYNLEWLRSFRQPNTESVLTVFHSPTVRERKGTAELENVVRHLQSYRPVNLEIVERREQQYVLTRKGKADILFDGPYGYGLNAIEAWAMGIPVLSGLNPSRYVTERTRQDMIDLIGYLPFYEFTPDTLAQRLEELLDSPTLRAEWADKGREYVERLHDDAVTVETLKGVYEEAMDIAP